MLIRAYRAFTIGEGNLLGMMGAVWESREFVASCRRVSKFHADPCDFAACFCGIYGSYSVDKDTVYTDSVLATCLFYGTVVLATHGVRATACTIEALHLCLPSPERSLNHDSLMTLVSPQTLRNSYDEIAYALSAKYDVPVSVVSDVAKLPTFDPITRYPKSSLIARIIQPRKEPLTSWQKRKVTPTESRVCRTLDYMVRHDGQATTSEIQALHCKEDVECIHGKTGLSDMIDTLTHSYDGCSPRIKRL